MLLSEINDLCFSLEDELGVILQTDQRERCAQVRWLSLEDNKTPIDKGVEQCTLFDIMPHPLYQRYDL